MRNLGHVDMSAREMIDRRKDDAAAMSATGDCCRETEVVRRRMLLID